MIFSDSSLSHSRFSSDNSPFLCAGSWTYEAAERNSQPLLKEHQAMLNSLNKSSSASSGSSGSSSSSSSGGKHGGAGGGNKPTQGLTAHKARAEAIANKTVWNHAEPEKNHPALSAIRQIILENEYVNEHGVLGCGLDKVTTTFPRKAGGKWKDLYKNSCGDMQSYIRQHNQIIVFASGWLSVHPMARDPTDMSSDGTVSATAAAAAEAAAAADAAKAKSKEGGEKDAGGKDKEKEKEKDKQKPKKLTKEEREAQEAADAIAAVTAFEESQAAAKRTGATEEKKAPPAAPANVDIPGRDRYPGWFHFNDDVVKPVLSKVIETQFGYGPSTRECAYMLMYRRRPISLRRRVEERLGLRIPAVADWIQEEEQRAIKAEEERKEREAFMRTALLLNMTAVLERDDDDDEDDDSDEDGDDENDIIAIDSFSPCDESKKSPSSSPLSSSPSSRVSEVKSDGTVDPETAAAISKAIANALEMDRSSSSAPESKSSSSTSSSTSTSTSTSSSSADAISSITGKPSFLSRLGKGATSHTTEMNGDRDGQHLKLHSFAPLALPLTTSCEEIYQHASRVSKIPINELTIHLLTRKPRSMTRIVYPVPADAYEPIVVPSEFADLANPQPPSSDASATSAEPAKPKTKKDLEKEKERLKEFRIVMDRLQAEKLALIQPLSKFKPDNAEGGVFMCFDVALYFFLSPRSLSFCLFLAGDSDVFLPLCH